MTQEALERTLMDWLLAGDHPALATLRAQYAAAEIEERELSGAGCLVHYQVPPDVPRLAGNAELELGDIVFYLADVETDGSAILVIRRGVLDMLELVMWDEPWPAVPKLDEVQYLTRRPLRNGRGYTLTPGANRDQEHLARVLPG
jgi:hypothetical protein